MPRKRGEPDPGYTIQVSSTLSIRGTTKGKPLTLEAIEAFVNEASARGADLSQGVSYLDHLSSMGYPAIPSIWMSVPDRG